MKIFSLQGTYGKRLAPQRDWIVILIGMLLFLAGSFAWNLWLFGRVVNGEVLGGAVASSPRVFDEHALEIIVETFESRTAEQTKYRNGTYRFIDPSK